VTDFLSTPDLLRIAHRAVGPDVQVRDLGLLESAAARPATTLYGDDAYPGLEGKAAALLLSLVNNHALVDGNKRLGWAATYVFVGLNGRALAAPSEDDAFDLVMRVADGTLTEVEKIAEVLRGWISRR